MKVGRIDLPVLLKKTAGITFGAWSAGEVWREVAMEFWGRDEGSVDLILSKVDIRV